jgi:hypothetical protein
MITGDESIGIAGLHNHHAEIVDVLHGIKRLLRRDALGLAQFVERSGVFLKFLGGFGIDHPDAIQRIALAGKPGSDMRLVTQQCDRCNLFLIDRVGRFQYTIIASLGKDHISFYNLGLINDLLNKCTSAHFPVSPYDSVKKFAFL